MWRRCRGRHTSSRTSKWTIWTPSWKTQRIRLDTRLTGNVSSTRSMTLLPRTCQCRCSDRVNLLIKAQTSSNYLLSFSHLAATLVCPTRWPWLIPSTNKCRARLQSVSRTLELVLLTVSLNIWPLSNQWLTVTNKRQHLPSTPMITSPQWVMFPSTSLLSTKTLPHSSSTSSSSILQRRWLLLLSSSLIINTNLNNRCNSTTKVRYNTVSNNNLTTTLNQIECLTSASKVKWVREAREATSTHTESLTTESTVTIFSTVLTGKIWLTNREQIMPRFHNYQAQEKILGSRHISQIFIIATPTMSQASTPPTTSTAKARVSTHSEAREDLESQRCTTTTSQSLSA